MHLAAWLCSRIIFICRDRGDFSGGLLPVLPVCRRDRAERVRRGAGNGCYGKSGQLSLGGCGFFGSPPAFFTPALYDHLFRLNLPITDVSHRYGYSEPERNSRDQKPRFFSCSSASVNRLISACS